MGAYVPLTLKYRPRKFSDLVGQSQNVKILERMISTGKLPSTLLFIGSRGLGKTTSARIVAKSLNCTGEDKPCGHCESCLAVDNGSSVDVVEIDAASHGNVADIRELKQQASFVTPGSYKVIILDEAHSLSRDAWNALLKLIEEPPANVLFILASTEVDKIPDTIVSRAVSFEFNRVSSEEIAKRLEYICQQEGFEYDPDALRLISRSTDGGLRDSVSMLDQASIYGDGKVTVDVVRDLLGTVSFGFVLDFIMQVLSGSPAALMPKVEEVYSVYSISQFIEEVCLVLMDLLYVKFGLSVDRNPQDVKALMDAIPKVTTKELLALIREFSGVQVEMRKSSLYGKNLFCAFLLRVVTDLGKLVPTDSAPVNRVESVAQVPEIKQEVEESSTVDVASMLSSLL